MSPVRWSAILIMVGTLLSESCGATAADIIYLDGHAKAVRDVGVSPNGKWLVSVGDDARVILRPATDLEKSHVVRPREGGLLGLAFTKDGKSVLAAGNLADFSRTSAIDGAIRVALDAPHSDDFIEFPVQGSIRHLTLVDDDTHVMYFCGGTSLLKLKLGVQHFSQETRLFGGFMGDAASSPTGRYFAATSQNRVNNRSAEPCQLTLLTAEGRETLIWRFKSQRDFYGAQVCFPTDELLLLCLPIGQLLTWHFSADQKQWLREGEPLPTVSGKLSAAESQSADEPLWVALDGSLVAIDRKSGAELQRIELNVGERTAESSPEPIVCLTFLKEPDRIVAGLWDGRLAVASIKGRSK